MSKQIYEGSGALAEAVTQFGIRMMHALARAQPGQNIFFSPIGMAASLAMAHDGAKGWTRRAIARALGFDGVNEDETFAGLIWELAASDPDIQLYIANGLWAGDEVLLAPDYTHHCREAYQAEIGVESGLALAPAVNGWVNRATHGKITRIIERLHPASALLLVNAVYFKGWWVQQFERRNTEEGLFTLADGQQKKCPMMNVWGRFGYYKNGVLQAIRLPYRGRRTSMIVLLPNAEDSLDRLLERLSPDQWGWWAGSLPLSDLEAQRVHLQMPRFRIEFEARLNDVLRSLGMKLPFDPEKADFSVMCPDCAERLYIDTVKHKAFVDVNEEGAEVAAATWTGLALGAGIDPTPEMIVDRPFFFAIRDDLTGAMLLAGVVYEP